MRVYTDGACRNKVGGWAWWNADTDESRSGVETPTTNQRMELRAALEAMNEHFNDKELTIVSDSAYVVNCFGQKWWIKWLANGWIGSKGKELANRDIWEPLLELVQQHGTVQFEWVKGHSGDPGNDKVDALAVEEVLRYGRTATEPAAKVAEAGSDASAEGSGVRDGGGAAPGLPADAVAGPTDAGDQAGESGGGANQLPDPPEAEGDPLKLARETYQNYRGKRHG
jgi:ribonuclease HI